MLRKGALESGLGEILLTVLVAAVISGAMFGPLGAQIGEGFQEAQQFTQVTTEVTVSDSETLGELGQYVFWRAWGCDKVEDETFSGLTSTNLTENGRLPCAGAGSTVAKGLTDPLKGGTGNDMEGKYSRVNFVINETITIKTGDGLGPDDKSSILLGVSTGEGTDKAGYSDWVRGGCWGYDPGVGDVWVNSWENRGPPYSFHSLFFKNGGGEDRIQRYGDGETYEDMWTGGQHQGLFCRPKPGIDDPRLAAPDKNTGFQNGDGADYEAPEDNYVSIKLCPGDKGYVETRKGNPTSTGEDSGSLTGGLAQNNGNLFGMIQITDMNSSCSAPPEPEGNPNEPVINSLSSSPDNYGFNGEQVLYQEDGEKIFRPDDSAGDDIMIWESLPAGSKRVEFEVLFKDKGHFRIDVINSDNDRVTNINTDATGTDELWMYCTTCDDSNSPPFLNPGNGDSYGIVWNYDLNTAYKIEVSRQSGEVSWKISDGTGTTLWSFSKDMNSDFSRVELEAWESWESGTTDDAVVRINDVQVYN